MNNKTEPYIVCAKLTCPDGTILRSSGGLFASHIDKSDGQHYYIDCTKHYVRVCNPTNNAVLEVIREDAPHEILREIVEWTSFGLKGDEKPKRKPISKLDTKHIEQIIKTQKHIQGTHLIKVFENELEYRKVNNEKI